MKLSIQRVSEINQFIKSYDPSLSNESKKKIAQKIVDFFMNENLTDNSKTVYISLAKKYVISKIKDKLLTDHIKPAKVFTSSVRNKQWQVRDNKPMFEISQQMIDKLISFKVNNTIYKLNIYLLFATGRRTGELINGKFTNIKGSKNISISGILKQKNIPMVKHEIQLIGSKTKILQKIKIFQKLINKTDEDNYRRRFQRNIKKILGDKWTPHTLRGVYAKYLFKNNNPMNMRINPFIMKVLGHASITASFSYTGIKLL